MRNRKRNIRNGWGNIGTRCKSWRLFCCALEFKIVGFQNCDSKAEQKIHGSASLSGQSSGAHTVERKLARRAHPAGSACPWHLQHCWNFWKQLHQYKPKHRADGIWIWGYYPVYHSQWCFFFDATQKIFDRLGPPNILTAKFVQQVINLSNGWHWKLSPEGAEKLLCQDFPLHKVRLTHMTDAVPQI